MHFKFYTFQVRTPKKIKEPELAYKIPTEDESASFLFSGASKVTILYVEIDYTF